MLLLGLSIYLVCSYVVYKYNQKLKSQGFMGITTAECFNPLKWMSVVFGYTMKFLIPQHVFEQYVLRFYDDYCRENCMIPGKCIKCGCDAVAKGWSFNEKCSMDNWGPIIFNKDKYEELRKQFPVTIKIEYGALQRD